MTVTTREDIASVAAQLAELTRTVDGLAQDLTAMADRADNQQEVVNRQQARIDLAARELTDVSDRLQAAADALRNAI